MKKSELKFVTFDQMLKKSMKSVAFRKAYYEEIGRIKLIRQIRELRIAKKMTQKKLAEKADMPQSVVARIESGTHSFSLDTLQRIARAFNKEIQFA